MNLFKKIMQVAVLVTLFDIAFPDYAYCYIDPGTGSYVFQIIVAAFVAVSFAVKVYWQKIKKFLGGLFNKKKDDAR